MDSESNTTGSPRPRSPIQTRSVTRKQEATKKRDASIKYANELSAFFENNHSSSQSPEKCDKNGCEISGGKRRKTYRRKSSSKKSLKTRYNRHRR
jgi:hypothetical protein